MSERPCITPSLHPPPHAQLTRIAASPRGVYRSGPLAMATYLSYTSTSGSYFNASDTNRTIKGWTRDTVVADPNGGMRAIAFTQGLRGIIVFRGTDLDTTTRSGQADSCADSLLFGGKLPSQLQPQCSAFTAAELDYYGRALAFARAAQDRHPTVTFALTGHSLGAGLAVIVAAALGPPSPAIVFSSPAVHDLVVKLVGQPPASLNMTERVVYLANIVDPVYHEAAALSGLPGRVCTWHVPAGAGTPAACRLCFADQPGYLHRNELECAKCFQTEHVFSQYFYTSIPGPRPTCATPDPGAVFPQPTLRAQRGTTPTIDGVLSPAEWDDAYSVLAVVTPTVQQFSPVTGSVDWALAEAWIKFDATHLYLGFDIIDDVAYVTACLLLCS